MGGGAASEFGKETHTLESNHLSPNLKLCSRKERVWQLHEHHRTIL
jgi:hypothetical protein